MRSGKIETLDSTIRTYLFGIGKRLSYQLIRKKGQTIEFVPTIEPEVNNIEDLIEQEAQTYQSQELSNALAKLGESCRRLLLLFYMHRGRGSMITASHWTVIVASSGLVDAAVAAASSMWSGCRVVLICNCNMWLQFM